MKYNVKNTIKRLPLHPGVELLSSDSHTTLFALNKPEGVKSHPNKPGIDKNSLLHAPYDLEKECYLCQLSDSELVEVYLLNRLDSPTSGVILLCLDAKLASEIHSLFKNHRVHKTYLAIVKHIPRTLHSTWRNRLSSEKLEEKEERKPTLDTLLRITDVLGVEIEDFIRQSRKAAIKSK